jgi:multidrug efflux pump subunit AcrA (membrane-fusion protein)
MKPLLFILATLLLWQSCATKPKEDADEAAATPVEVAPARSGDMHQLVTAEAVIYPINQATIVPKISAPVRQFNVQRGDHVKQGELLAVLEDGDLRAATKESQQLYQQAQANLETARALTLPDDMTKAKSDLAAAREGLDAAKRLYDNRVTLVKEGALAQKLVDDAKVALVQAQSLYDTASQHLHALETAGQSAQLKSSEAQASAAKAHYESSAAQSSYGEVRSPISGVIADRGVNVGDMASSSSALFTIVDISRVVARASVPVNQATALRKGQPAVIKSATGDITGRVTVVSPAVDANTTTVQVWVEASNAGEALKLGSTVTISIDAGNLPNAVIVPIAALLASDEGGEKVMVALANGTAQERKVETGVRNGDDVQILNGVKPGENVITKGALGLDDKAKIEVAKPVDKSGADK